MEEEEEEEGVKMHWFICNNFRSRIFLCLGERKHTISQLKVLCWVMVLSVSEPPAAEGQLHGGAGGGSEEAEARLPLHRCAALRQAEETDRRVRN